MGNPFSKPKPQPIPAPTPLPPPPERSDTETAALAEEQRRRLNPNGGRSSAYLTAGGIDQGSASVRYLGGSNRT
jgi:hypothetical protein